MKEVTAFKTDDGKIFEAPWLAEKHELRRGFIEFLDGNPLFSPQGDRVDADDLWEWITNHRDEVIRFFGHALLGVPPIAVNDITIVVNWTDGYIKAFAPRKDADVRMIRADDPEQRFAERAEADIVERDQHCITTEEA